MEIKEILREFTSVRWFHTAHEGEMMKT